MLEGEFAERLSALRETRARLPELVRNRHASRHRRTIAGHTGRLVLIEADEPARADLAAGDDPLALADRGELLARLVTALGIRGIDGVIATADIVDDLVLLDVLDDMLAIGSMNRGGLAGSVFAMDERFTGYDAEAIAASHLDGGKLQLAIDPQDAHTADAIEACGRVVSALSANASMALVQPTWIRHGTAGPEPDRSLDAMVRAVDVAAALGSRSPFTWLALSPVPDLAAVVAATTLPVLLMADGSVPLEDTATWEQRLAVPGVRGMVLPGAALYPADGDVAAVVERVATLVHSG